MEVLGVVGFGLVLRVSGWTCGVVSFGCVGGCMFGGSVWDVREWERVEGLGFGCGFGVFFLLPWNQSAPESNKE